MEDGRPKSEETLEPQTFKLSNIQTLKPYTRSQLALRNGQDREEIWVAYEGVIYDVSHSRHWKNGAMPGIHYGHWAGQDLTDELPRAPHTDSVFRRMKVVGRLE